MKQDILKRVIINGETGSSWSYRPFNKIQVNIISRVDAKKLFIIWLFFSAMQKSGFYWIWGQCRITGKPSRFFRTSKETY